MHIILQTPRLILRQFTEDDTPLIWELNSDPEVVKYVHEPLLSTLEQAREIIVNIILPQYKNALGRWAIHTKNNDEFIGWCGFKAIAPASEIDLGYRLRRASWGRGYATEVSKEVLDYGFTTLRLKEVTAKAHIDNTASIHVLEKIGMQFITETIEDNCTVKVFRAFNPKI